MLEINYSLESVIIQATAIFSYQNIFSRRPETMVQEITWASFNDNFFNLILARARTARLL